MLEFALKMFGTKPKLDDNAGPVPGIAPSKLEKVRADIAATLRAAEERVDKVIARLKANESNAKG